MKNFYMLNELYNIELLYVELYESTIFKTNYIGYAKNDKYFIKRLWKLEDKKIIILNSIFNIQKQLKKVSIPYVLKSVSGNYIEKIGEYYYIIMEYLNNDGVPEKIQVLGKSLGNLHRNLRNVYTKNILDFELIETKQKFNNIEFYLLNRTLSSQLLDEEKDILKNKERLLMHIYEYAHVFSALDKQLIHGDLGIRNIICNKKDVYFIDFENIHYGSIYEDISKLWISYSLKKESIKDKEFVSKISKYLFDFCQAYLNGEIVLDCMKIEEIIKLVIYKYMQDIDGFINHLNTYKRMPKSNTIIFDTITELCWFVQNYEFLVETILEVGNTLVERK